MGGLRQKRRRLQRHLLSDYRRPFNGGVFLLPAPRLLPLFRLAAGTGLVGAALGSVLVSLIPLPMALPLLTDYPQQYAISPGATVAIVVLLQPLVDEILFRGLLFGSLRKYSRLLAYVVSTLAFALCSVWQFVPLYGFSYLLLGI
ncbi:MAG: CPBP family intramembrane glutamic endopeptidase, partial [Oscillospiraceae bacterium]